MLAEERDTFGVDWPCVWLLFAPWLRGGEKTGWVGEGDDGLRRGEVRTQRGMGVCSGEVGRGTVACCGEVMRGRDEEEEEDGEAEEEVMVVVVNVEEEEDEEDDDDDDDEDEDEAPAQS